MTELALIWLGSLAVLATLGLFVEFGDDPTRVLVTFTGAVLWGLFGLSAYDVIVRSTVSGDASEPIMPLVVLGLGMAIVVGLFAFKMLLEVVRGEVMATSSEDLMP